MLLAICEKKLAILHQLATILGPGGQRCISLSLSLSLCVKMHHIVLFQLMTSNHNVVQSATGIPHVMHWDLLVIYYIPPWEF